MAHEESPQAAPDTSAQQVSTEQLDAQENIIEADREDMQMASVYQKTASGDMFAPHGNNARITVINYYGKVVQGALEHVYQAEDDEELTQAASEKDFLEKNLSFELEGVSRLFSSRSSPHPRANELPLDEKGLSDWYYKLTEYEQCFVQAIAICHGAPAHDLYQEADVLYRLVQRQKYVPLVQTEKNSTPEQGNVPLQDISIPRQPRLLLLDNTHTVSKRAKGAECLFWEDVDEYGLSQFGHRVLAFLARELISKGEHWPDLLKTIHDWSKAQHHTRQIARALGVIYWCQNTFLLQQKGKEWAKESSISARRKVTSLLEGAFEIEQLQATEEGEVRIGDNMVVILLLREWTKTVHTTLNKANINMGCAIASTYGAIGKREQYTALTLQGFRTLLDIGTCNTLVDIRPLTTSVTSNYVSLVWAGHGRLVLTELSELIQTYIYHYQHPKQLKERDYYHFSRKLWLEVIIDAFFLIAAAVGSKQASQNSDPYQRALPQQLEIPDPDRRNIFLWAIIAHDELTKPLLTLLCAIITTPQRGNAFELIGTWAEALLTLWKRNMQEGKPYRIFVGFLVDLGRQLQLWQSHLQRRGYQLAPVLDIYCHQLQVWGRHKHGQSAKKHQLVADVLSFFKDTETVKEKKP